MSLSGAITAIQDYAEACTGVKFAPDYPSETVGALPAVMTYPIEGNPTVQAQNDMVNFHVLSIDYITPRTLLKTAQANAITFVEEFPKKLATDPTLGGQCTTIQFGDGALTYSVFDTDWDGTQVRVVRFRLSLKIRESAV